MTKAAANGQRPTRSPRQPSAYGGVFGASLVGGELFSRGVICPIGQPVEVTCGIAAGDLTVELNVDGKDETAQWLQATAEMRDNLNNIADAIN